MSCRLLIDAHNHQLLGHQLAELDVDVFVFETPERVLHNGRPVAGDIARPQVLLLSFELLASGHAAAALQLALAGGELQWVHTAATGLDHPLFARVAAAGVRISNSHAQAPAIAETVLASVLALYQRLPARLQHQRAHRWQRETFRELAGSHWLLLGFGAIGRGVAERARGFGCQVTAVRRTPVDDRLADRSVTLAQLPAHIGAADVVVIACPLTADTRNLFDADLLARMRPGATLVNVARGAIVDEPALIAGLRAGTPAQAVLDVFATEPLAADSPLWDLPNVLVTPHASNAGDGVAQRRAAVFIDNIGSWLADGRLLTEVRGADLPRSD